MYICMFFIIIDPSVSVWLESSGWGIAPAGSWARQRWRHSRSHVHTNSDPRAHTITHTHTHTHKHSRYEW